MYKEECFVRSLKSFSVFNYILGWVYETIQQYNWAAKIPTRNPHFYIVDANKMLE